MPSARSDARWPEAVTYTVSLQLFVLLIFLPRMIERHGGFNLVDALLDWSTILVSMGLGLALFAIFRATVHWPNRKRTVTLIAAVAGFAVLNALSDIVWTSFIASNVQGSWVAIPKDLWRVYAAAFNYFMVFAVNVALFQLAFSRRRSLTIERQLVDARTAAQQAQLTALRYQINPHFLFNALNSISALIVTRRNEDAEDMTGRLSGFLRSSLATDPAELVPLEEELHLIEDYLEIEGVRFGDRLDVAIHCQPEAGQALVPGFLVQPLVENAIKHGVAPSRDPVHIDIDAAVVDGCLEIVVENGRTDDDAPRGPGAGVGLENVRQRLLAVYGPTATLATDALPRRYRALIRIPDLRARA